MGVILNRFDRLMKLREESAFNEKFKLAAIIVHNPKDKNLIKHLRDHFLDFAKITGENFLFITFVQPPREYADAIKRGEYKYSKLLVSDSKQLSDTDEKIDYLVRKFYGLPKDGSYLVLAKKLSDKDVFKVLFTTGSLPYQLMNLTSYCNTPQDFDGLIKKLNAEPLIIKEVFFDSLLKIVSLISPSSLPEKYGLYSYSQRELAKKTISEEKEKLLAALQQTSDDDDFENNVIELYGLIEYAYMNVFNEGQHTHDKEQKCEHYNILDGKSQTFWKTYSRLSNFINGASRDELDYSAFILYLGKIVERELNLSVCQMLRQAMGIKMPSFYNKYCNEAGWVNIPTKKMDVSLNTFIKTPEGKRLKGVALGNLLHAYKTAVKLETSSDERWSVRYREYIEEIPKDFLDLWENIANLRNEASHCEASNNELYESTVQKFNDFLKEYVSDLYMIKEKLRPGYKPYNRRYWK